MANWVKENLPTFSNWRYITGKIFTLISGKVAPFVALFIVIYIWAKSSRSPGLSEDEAFFFAMGITGIISFLWSKLSKKLNL